MMEIDVKEFGELSVKMIDVLESDLGRKESDGVKMKIGLVHIAVEIEHEDANGECWTEVYVKCNERRGWVKEAFLHRLAEFSEQMEDVGVEVDEDDDSE